MKCSLFEYVTDEGEERSWRHFADYEGRYVNSVLRLVGAMGRERFVYEFMHASAQSRQRPVRLDVEGAEECGRVYFPDGKDVRDFPGVFEAVVEAPVAYVPPVATSTGRRHDTTAGPFYVVSGCIVDGRGNLVATRYSWTRLDAETGETKEARGREDAIEPCEADANCHLLAASWDMQQALLAMLAEHGSTYPDSPATAAARAALTRSYGYAFLSQKGKE